MQVDQGLDTKPASKIKNAFCNIYAKLVPTMACSSMKITFSNLLVNSAFLTLEGIVKLRSVSTMQIVIKIAHDTFQNYD